MGWNLESQYVQIKIRRIQIHSASKRKSVFQRMYDSGVKNFHSTTPLMAKLIACHVQISK